MTARAGKGCHALTEAKPSQRQSSSPPSQRSLNSRHCNYNGPTDERCRRIPHRSVCGSAQHREAAVLGGHEGHERHEGRQVTGASPLGAWRIKTRGRGFESHPTPAAPPLAACPRGRWPPRTGLTCARADAIAAASELHCPRRPCPRRALSSGPQRSPRATPVKRRSR